MQTIWSRIAQTGVSCRCPSCAGTASGIARRSTTATGRRPAKYLTSSTLLYSGIFAAAATTDALVKEKRNLQWEKAIASVKKGLEDGAELTKRSRLDSSSLVDEDFMSSSTQPQVIMESRDDKDVWYRESAPAARLPSIRSSASDEVEALFEKSQTQLRRSAFPASTGIDLRRYNVAPQSIYAYDRSRQRASDKRWSTKKLRLNELAIDKLALTILLELDQQNLLAAAKHVVIEDFQLPHAMPRTELESLLAQTKKNIKLVQKIDNTSDAEAFAPHAAHFAKYRQDDNGYHHRAASRLNSALRGLFEQHRQGAMQMPEMLIKICHNLTSSSAPPSLACYNTLLKGLGQSGTNHLAADRVISAMRVSHIRMNEDSIVSMMDHYRKANDYNSFKRFLERMRGLHGGFELANPTITINEKSEGRCIRKDGNNDKIIQKPYPVPKVFAALIKGVLHFEGFQAAMEVCQMMGPEGWGLSMQGLTPLLLECAHRKDWNSGSAVWRQIKLVQQRSRRQGRAERLFVDTYATMLRLCGVCGEERMYHTIFEEALKARYSRDMLMDSLRVCEEPGPTPYYALDRSSDAWSGPTDDQSRNPPLQSANEQPDSSYKDTARGAANPVNDSHASSVTCSEAESASSSAARSPFADMEPSHAQDTAPSSETDKRAPAASQDVRQDTSEGRPVPSSAQRQIASSRREAHELEKSHLDGDLNSYVLDGYDLAERPMSMIGS